MARLRTRFWAGLVLFGLALVALLPAARADEGKAQEYRLGPGDGVKISVFQNPDLSLETRVSDTGAISYPLVGSVQIGGLTVAAAERAIADGLKKGGFVLQPNATLAAAMLFIVLGPAILAYRFWGEGVKRAGPATAGTVG